MDTSANELGVTVAVEEPLSEIAQLRLDLDAYEEIFPTVHPGSTEKQWQPFLDAQDKIYDGLTDKYHMLIDLIDSQQSQLDTLRALLAEVVTCAPDREPVNVSSRRDYLYHRSFWAVGKRVAKALKGEKNVQIHTTTP